MFVFCFLNQKEGFIKGGLKGSLIAQTSFA